MDSSQVALLVGIAIALLVAFAIGMKPRPAKTSATGPVRPAPEPESAKPEPAKVSTPPGAREITLSAKYEEKLRGIVKDGGWKGARCQLPGLPAFFTGRRCELARALALLDAGNAPRALAITAARGLPGVGRSGFAAALAHVVAERYPDGELFIDLRGDDSEAAALDVADVMRHVWLSLNPGAELPKDAGEIPSAYRRALEGRRVLILAGNVRPQPYLELLIPPAGSLVLLTSREALAFARIETIAIEPFTRPDARAFLRESSTRMKRETDPRVDLLAELSGQLPAAMRMNAARLHSNPALPIDAHFDALKKAGALQQPLDAAIRTSFEGMSERLQRTLRRLAAISVTFDAAAAAAICEQDEEAASEQLDALNAAGMLHVVERGKPVRFDLHEWARSFARQMLSAAEDDTRRAQLGFAGYCARLPDASRARSIRAAWKWTRDFIQRYQTHADGEFSLTDLPESFAAPARVPAPLYPTALRVLLDFSDAGTRIGGIPWLEAAVSAARALHDRAGEGRALANLGKARAQSGEARLAVACFEEWVEIARGAGDRRDEADALGRLGAGWMDAGFPDRGTGCFEAQLVIAREIGDRAGEVRALDRLGKSKASLGDFQNAAGLYDEQLRIAREIGDRGSEAGALENLGLVWVRLNDPAKGADFHRKQLRLARELGDRAGESRALGHLGHAELQRGEIDEAIAHYEEQLKLARDSGDESGESHAHGSLGVAFARRGDLRNSVAHYEQQSQIARKTGNRLGEATALANIGTGLERLGDFAGTAASWEKALAIYESLGSPSAESIRRWLERARKALGTGAQS